MEHQILNELPPLPNRSSPNLDPAANPAEVLPAGPERQAEQAVESQPASPLVPSQTTASTAMPATFQPSLPAADNTAMPVIADDADLIEKEWVVRAKEIVARTRHDPYQQNKEVELMKADYMKKRYNKDIKITED